MVKPIHRKKIVLVGNPNVGKSVIFASLTGKYVTVSNYPGTTVEIARGTGKIGNYEYDVIDTPGMYSLLTLAEDERVARSILFTEEPEVIVQVADAKNLERMLHFTLQLIEAEVPLILDLNLMDEAERAGITIDVKALEKELGIPVVATVATEKQGLDELKQKIAEYKPHSTRKIRYDKPLENLIQELEQLLKGEYKISRRAIVLLLLQDDAEIKELVQEQMGAEYALLEEKIREIKNRYTQALTYIIALARQKLVNDIVAKVTISRPVEVLDFRERLSRLMINPFTGIPILLLVIYGLYEFVGVFGAMISVSFIEKHIFGKYINPLATQLITALIPVRVIQELFVFDYGILTLGIRYAIAIILPIVTTFFIAFSIIEDTGYLPRLALLIDRLFKGIGLNGRAVIPIVLGFGCDTMATLVTRTLETRRERIIATFLLALAVPCSAQLGVIFALLSQNVLGLWIFVTVMVFVFMFIGYLTAKIMPGEKPMFYMEIPPLRLPRLSNILLKTYSRVEWYLKEVLPLFILASVLIWIGRLIGLFDLLLKVLSYPVTWIGLPEGATRAFLFGFFRRDYGAAGLYDLKIAGVLSGTSLIVAAITLALFMPCIAQFVITIKERGLKMALAIAAFIFPFAFMMGFVVNFVLNTLGVRL